MPANLPAQVGIVIPSFHGTIECRALQGLSEIGVSDAAIHGCAVGGLLKAHRTESMLDSTKQERIIVKKTYRQLEGIVRGFSNHRRIQILELLDRQPELSLLEITKIVRSGFRPVSEHLRRMAIAGLILKRNEGRSVRHRLTERGRNVLLFLRKVE